MLEDRGSREDEEFSVLMYKDLQTNRKEGLKERPG